VNPLVRLDGKAGDASDTLCPTPPDPAIGS
jgi:hypothetical protein